MIEGSFSLVAAGTPGGIFVHRRMRQFSLRAAQSLSILFVMGRVPFSARLRASYLAEEGAHAIVPAGAPVVDPIVLCGPS